MKNHFSIILYFCLISTFFSCSNPKQEQKNDEQIVLPDAANLVKVKSLAIKDFNKETVSNGTLSVAKKADLKFEQSDIIERIYVKNGQRVVAGQMIASLVKFKYENALDQASDNLKKAKLELQDVLIGQGYKLEDSLKVPKSVMELAKVRSGYDNAITQYKLADHNLNSTVLYAPFAGVVANLFIHEHNMPVPGEPFCSILTNTGLNVDFMVLENELQRININDKVIITPISYSAEKVEGRITEINPFIDKNGMVRVQASVRQSEQIKLYEGMNVKVHIQHLLARQLAIPKEALELRSNKEVVFTYQNGKAHWNYVTTGGENSNEFLVVAGLKEGDQVIYGGNVDLAHETPVEITE
jgi:RND family efflux transporter MFP subunit